MADPEPTTERSPVEQLTIALLLSAVRKEATSFTVVAEEDGSAQVGYSCHVWFEIGGDWVREMEPPANMHGPIVRTLLGYTGLEPVKQGEVRGRFVMALGDGRKVTYQMTGTFSKARAPMAAVVLVGYE